MHFSCSRRSSNVFLKTTKANKIFITCTVITFSWTNSVLEYGIPTLYRARKGIRFQASPSKTLYTNITGKTPITPAVLCECSEEEYLLLNLSTMSVATPMYELPKQVKMPSAVDLPGCMYQMEPLNRFSSKDLAPSYYGSTCASAALIQVRDFYIYICMYTCFSVYVQFNVQLPVWKTRLIPLWRSSFDLISFYIFDRNLSPY